MPAWARISLAFGKRHEDRQAPLVGQGQDVRDRGFVQGEALGARVELDPDRSRAEAALDLRYRRSPRVDAA
jgi:hypothetical protein